MKTATQQGSDVKGSGEREKPTGREPAKDIPERVETPQKESGFKTAAQEGGDGSRPALMEESISSKPVSEGPGKAETPGREPAVKTADQMRGDMKSPAEAEKAIGQKPVIDRTKASSVARRDAEAETEELKAGIEKIRERLKLAAARSPEHDRNDKMAAVKALKIKVLYGKNMSAAKLIARKLTGLGYDCRVIDKAPRSNLADTTIYFASKYEREAKRLAAQLGGNAVFKPLTWPSQFHMIIVTGR